MLRPYTLFAFQIYIHIYEFIYIYVYICLLCPQVDETGCWAVKVAMPRTHTGRVVRGGGAAVGGQLTDKHVHHFASLTTNHASCHFSGFSLAVLRNLQFVRDARNAFHSLTFSHWAIWIYIWFHLLTVVVPADNCILIQANICEQSQLIWISIESSLRLEVLLN